MDDTPGSTTDRLLAAGLDALLDLTPADLVSAVGTRRIAARAGLSAATLLHHFGSVAAYADALVARVFDPGNLPMEDLEAAIARVVRSGLPVEAGDAYHRSEFARLTTDRGLRLRMGLWALGAGTTDGIYRDYLRTTDRRLHRVTDALVAGWGREFRPPFTTPIYVAAQVALLNGMAIRHLVDPDLSTDDRFSLAASSLTMISLRLQGDRHDMADRIAEVNYYPLRRSRGGVSTAEGHRTRAALLAAAAELFGTRGYAETTVAQIARHAGLSSSTLYKHFAGKEAVAGALFRKQAEDALQAGATRQTPSSDSLGDHLAAVAAFVGDRREYAAAYLTDLMTNRPDVEADPFLAATLPLVAQRFAKPPTSGDVAPQAAADPAEVAQALLGVLIGRVLARPADLPGGQAAHALRLVLGGRLAPLPG